MATKRSTKTVAEMLGTTPENIDEVVASVLEPITDLQSCSSTDNCLSIQHFNSCPRRSRLSRRMADVSEREKIGKDLVTQLLHVAVEQFVDTVPYSLSAAQSEFEGLVAAALTEQREQDAVIAEKQAGKGRTIGDTKAIAAAIRGGKGGE